jgi:hypothetical protein
MPFIRDFGTVTPASLGVSRVVKTLTGETGMFQFEINTKNLANGEVLRVQISVKTLTGSTLDMVFDEEYADIQAKKVKFSIPIPAYHQIQFEITQTGGTLRAYEWKVWVH